MADDVVEVEAIEEPVGPEREPEAIVRPLPQRRAPAELDVWRSEVRAVAIAAAGGLAAGAATAAVVTAVRAKATRKGGKRVSRRSRREESDGVLASRSFRVDVHLLDR